MEVKIMFRGFHCRIADELRLHFGEDSDSDLEEVLAEDEADGVGEGMRVIRTLERLFQSSVKGY